MKLTIVTQSILGLTTLLTMTTVTAFAQVVPISDEQAKSSGPGHPWHGTIPGVNLYSLAKQTDIPLTGWRMRGGMPVMFSLHRSSQAVYSNANLGSKWSHSYDVHLDRWNDAGIEKAALVWGNHLIQMFILQAGEWVPADGYRDTLEATFAGYRVRLKKSNILLEFEASLIANRFRLQRIIDQNNNTLNVTYDANGRLTTITDPNNRKLMLAYDAVTNLLKTVKWQVGNWSRTWTLLYDTSGRLNKVKWPAVTTDSGSMTFQLKIAYNSANNISSLTDRTGQVWKYAYDSAASDRLKSEQWPGNASTQKMTYVYSSPTQRKVKDPSGAEVRYFYDTAGRVLTQIKDKLNNTTSFTYNDPDYIWLPSRITYPLSILYQYDYDARGNVVGYTDASGSRWDYAYDSRNRLLQILEPLVTDAWGITEPARHRSDYLYDTRGNLIELRRYTDSSNFTSTLYHYDGFGNLIQRTNALGHLTLYAYDLYGNLIRITTPTGRTHDLFYNSAAQTHGFTIPNASMDGTGTMIHSIYDEWGRLRTVDLPAGTDTIYSYDANSRLLRVVDSTGITDRTYTPQGWLASETNSGMGVNYTYFPNGLRQRMAAMSGLGSHTIEYMYDGLNRLVQLLDNGMPNHFSYDAASRLIAQQLASGMRSEYTYMHNRLSAVRHYDAFNSLIRSYQYDYQSNRLLLSVAELAGTTTRYRYDFQNRLVREERTGSVPYDFQWHYDSVGNRVMENASGVVSIYQYDPDDLLLTVDRMGSLTHYLYDAAGRVIQRDRAGMHHQFAYDELGRLDRIDEWNGSHFVPHRVYEYDGLDRRVRRQVFNEGLFTGMDRYLHDSSQPVIEDHNLAGGGTAVVRNVWADGLLAVHDTAAGSRWCATDGLGDLRGWTDMNGMSGSYQAVHNAFGAVQWEMGHRPAYGWGADSSIRSDGDAGLYYTGSSYYDSVDGVWYVDVGYGIYVPKRLVFSIFSEGIISDVGDLTVQVIGAPLVFQDEPVPIEIVPLHLQGCRPIQDAKPVPQPLPKVQEEPDPNEFPPNPPLGEPPPLPASKPDPEEEMKKMLEEQHRQTIRKIGTQRLPFKGKPRGVVHKGQRK